MKLHKDTKVFCLRLKGKNHIKLINSNDELYKIIERLKDCTKGLVDLNFLLALDFSIKTIEGKINNQKVRVNLYQNNSTFSRVSLMEMEGDVTYSLDDIKNSTLFYGEIELLWSIGIHDNKISQIISDNLN
jgi:hypothetical protein